jgi:hypothetical protein
MGLGRARGAVLRLVRRRRAAVALGALMVAPTAWLQSSGAAPAWWIEGLAFVLGATGAAVIWAGLTGARPDWIDPGDSDNEAAGQAGRS